MKCKYCGKETNKEYCDFDCRKSYLDYFDEEDKYKSRRRPLMIAAIVISIPFIIIFYGLGVTIMCILEGLILITHPFATAKMKAKAMTPKSVKNTMQLIGLALMLIGIPFLLLINMP